VRIIDNFSTGKRENIQHLTDNARLDVLKLDLATDNLDDAFQDTDYVFHQAALPSVPLSVENPLRTHHQCVTATLRVLIAAKDNNVRRLVYAASSAAYGDIEAEYTTETMIPDPKSPYGAAKLFGEYYSRVFTEVYGLETVSLRYFNVFGPRQDPNSAYAAVIPKFITRMLEGKAPIIYGDGLQTRDFTYIDNIVHGNLLAATVPQASGKILNLATSDRVSLLDLVEKLNQFMGTTFEPVHEDARAGDIKHSRADITLAGESLGYEPVVGFDEGLSQTVEWYQKPTEP